MLPHLPPARDALERHPHSADCQRLVHNAFRLDLERAGLDTHDLPFAIALFDSDEIRLIGHRSGAPGHGLIEENEGRLWSLRPVLRACARCSHVGLSFEQGVVIAALRVQVEHRHGPPLDVYLPHADEGRWWVEAGSSWLFEGPDR
ncbi:MAG: hypothetical protein CL927_12695 [Deltaproteobacteria bacterium]|nr:hypothetical protein [Deltaproteobacteria bacterium]HCH66582.1 hypothetical protein [Deltaproteobacteria bacterium]